MASKITKKYIVGVALFALLVVFMATGLRYSKSYVVDIGQIENIDGIPFPQVEEDIVITEKLAHADVYLDHSPFARALEITVKFKSLDSTSLSLGIRENPFWLSYPKYLLCCAEDQSGLATITIPVTDKIVDAKGSLDLMFFATNADSAITEDEGVGDKTMWILEDIQVVSVPTKPTLSGIKDYIKSRLTFERPL